MRSQLRIISRILFVMMALSLGQCAKKTKSQDVIITVSPAQPIVFTSDFQTTQGGAPVTIKGPWFNFTVQIDNQSDTPVTIIGLHIEVTGYDSNNQPKTASADFVPASDNTTTVALTCTYSDFGEFEAKGVTTGTLTSKGTLFETPTGTNGCPAGPVSFFSSGNPKPSSTSLIRYTVKVQPIGYFGVRNSPTDRFDNFTTIYTQ